MSSFIIQLHNLELFGYYGLYEEEKVLGAEFEVNISVKVEAPKTGSVSIRDTVDYAEVYELVKTIFSQPQELLETICLDMATAIKGRFPLLIDLSIQIIKLHPPIIGFIGSVSVTYQKSYSETQ
jgi:dihydroneopterin aldolase